MNSYHNASQISHEKKRRPKRTKFGNQCHQCTPCRIILSILAGLLLAIATTAITVAAMTSGEQSKSSECLLLFSISHVNGLMLSSGIGYHSINCYLNSIINYVYNHFPDIDDYIKCHRHQINNYLDIFDK